MKRETDHVVLRDSKAICLHCSEEYKIGLPCPLRMLVAITNTFLDMHRHCPPPAPERTEVMNYNERIGSIAARAELCVEAISGDKPALTANEMAAMFPVSRGSFDRTMNLLRVDKAKRIYIVDYRRPLGNRGGAWVALYKAGNLPDAPPPTLTPEEERARRADISRRQVERNAQAKAAKKALEKPATTPTLDPFSLALFGRAA